MITPADTMSLVPSMSTAGACTPPDWGTVTATDIFNALDKGEDFLAGGSLGSDVDQGLMSSLTDGVGLADDADFNEVFTDISDFLLDTQDVEMTSAATVELVPPPVFVLPLPKRVTLTPNKRKAHVAFATAPCSNPDHNDYVLKQKKPKIEIEEVMSTSGATPTRQHMKEQRYFQRRKKNNVASKRSRETRKMKFVNMEDQAVELEKENEMLQQKLVLMESIAKKMKALLVEKLAKGGK